MQPPATLASVSQPRWYVVQCKPRQDQRARENLQRQGYCCYLPTRKVERLQHGRKREVEEPLFPGYLFISLDAVNNNWYPIRSTRGVSQIVRVREHPLPVQDEIIGMIRSRLEDPAPCVPCLRPGEHVLITEGCFSQFEAIFLANDGDQRVTLLLNVLQRDHQLSFPLASVRKCANL
jgi:transcriptional antiterminator RfaH